MVKETGVLNNMKTTYKVNKFNLRRELIVIFFLIYFTSKLLWDSLFFSVFEYLSLILIAGVALKFFLVRFNSCSKRDFNTFLIWSAFCLYVVLNSIFQSTTGKQFFRSLYEYVFYSLIFFAAYYLTDKCNLEKCVKYVSLFGILIAFLSWLEFFTHSYIVFDGKSSDLYGQYQGFRAVVFSRSFLSHGVILGVFSICSLYSFFKTRRFTWLIICVLQYATILTTGSRGPLVSFGIAIVFMILFYVKCDFGKKYFKIALGVLFFLLLIGLIMLFSNCSTSIATVDYFLLRIRKIFDWKGDAGNVGRLEIWKQSLNWFKTDVLFGIGPSKTGSWSTETIGVTESGVLKRLCELGIIGFAIHYFFVIRIIVKGVKTIKKLDRADRYKMIWLFGILVGILIHDCVLQATEEIMVSFFMWFALGAVESICNGKNRKKITKIIR